MQADSGHLLRTAGARFYAGFRVVQWPLLALALIFLFNLVFMPDFFTISVRNGRLVGSLVDMLKRASPRMIIALGMTLVIATEGIDVSVGSVAAIAAGLSVMVIRGGDISYLAPQTVSTVPILFIVAVAILGGMLAGLFNGILVAKVRIQPIVATLILMVTGRGIAKLITGGYVLNYDHPQFEQLGSGAIFGLPFPVVIAVGVMILLALVTRMTPFGLFIQSTGGNDLASWYSGLNTQLVRLLVYIVSGVCAAIAGIIITADVKSADPSTMGLWIELEAILCVVMGGTSLKGGRFTFAGTIIGALIFQTVITTLLTRGFPVEYTLIVQALVVVVVLILGSDRVKNLQSRRSSISTAKASGEARNG